MVSDLLELPAGPLLYHPHIISITKPLLRPLTSVTLIIYTTLCNGTPKKSTIFSLLSITTLGSSKKYSTQRVHLG